jgi:ABC-type enterochelin transport system permease subunit
MSEEQIKSSILLFATAIFYIFAWMTFLASIKVFYKYASHVLSALILLLAYAMLEFCFNIFRILSDNGFLMPIVHFTSAYLILSVFIGVFFLSRQEKGTP